MEMLNRNRRDVLKGAAAAAAASLAPTVWTSVSAAAVDRKAGAIAIDKVLSDAVQEKQVPGIVGIAANGSGVIYEGAFGKRNVETGPTMTLDTVFLVASMTKAVTGVAAMQLVEQGKLTLDDPIEKMLPALASPQVLEGFDEQGNPKLRPAKGKITLRQLLTHTSGFTYDFLNANTGRYVKFKNLPDVITGKNLALTTPLAFDPGTDWEYGISSDLAGKAVEAASGENLDVYFRKHIFEPLGMKSTGFLIGDQENRLATVHGRKEDGSFSPLNVRFSQEPEFFGGGGGLYGTASDYLVFLQMLMHGGAFNGATILKSSTIEQMSKNNMGDVKVRAMKTQAPALTADIDFGKLFPGQDIKWGLSFMINPKQGPAGRSANSLSWAGIANTYFWLDPSKKVAGVLLSQTLPFADPVSLGIYDRFERGVYKLTSET
jgi:CubicO group peptidase (beta-lactamase class C family)